MAEGQKKEEWLRDGNLLYTLEHAGWDKGNETFQNRLTVRVDINRVSTATEADADDVATQILDFLNRAESGLVKELQDRLEATERGERAADNEVERLQAVVKQLLTALMPFAKAYQAWGGGNAREHFASSVVPVHFLRAAEAVTKAIPTTGAV